MKGLGFIAVLGTVVYLLYREGKKVLNQVSVSVKNIRVSSFDWKNISMVATIEINNPTPVNITLESFTGVVALVGYGDFAKIDYAPKNGMPVVPGVNQIDMDVQVDGGQAIPIALKQLGDMVKGGRDISVNVRGEADLNGISIPVNQMVDISKFLSAVHSTPIVNSNIKNAANG